MKILKTAAIILGAVIAVLLVANGIWVRITGAQLEEKLAALRAAGDPLSLAEDARKPIPPEENAAVFLRRARSDLEAVEKELSEVYAGEGSEDGRFSDSDLKAIESALETYSKVIPLLEQAAACPEYDTQADYTAEPGDFLAENLDNVQHLRGAAPVLRLRALLLLAKG